MRRANVDSFATSFWRACAEGGRFLGGSAVKEVFKCYVFLLLYDLIQVIVGGVVEVWVGGRSHNFRLIVVIVP